MKEQNDKAWLLTLPALTVLFLVGVVPLLATINYSFFDIFTKDSRFWVGTDWYQEILQSERFYESLVRSVLFSTLILLIEIPLGILLAISFPKKGIAVSICLVIVSIPLLIPWNIIPIIWTGFLSTEFGVLGKAITSIGIDIDWKFNPIHTWISIILMDVWHWTSLVVLLCYSSLTTIPSAFYQTAAIDGASRWQVLRYIELPKMKSVLLMAILLRFMDSLMIYTEAFRFNAGGPNNSTMFLAMDLGEDIAAFNYGRAAARSVIYFIIVLSVAWAFKTIHTMQESEHDVTAR